MRRAFLETARKIELSESIDVLWRHLHSGIQPFGVENIIYMKIADQPPHELYVRSSLPDNWPKAEFEDPEFIEPFLTHCCATFEITKAGIEFLPDHDTYLDETKQSYIRKGAQFNFRAALGIPCQLVGTGQHGGFILGNGMSAFEFERNILPLAGELQCLCLITDNRIQTIRSQENKASQERPLSPREYETMLFISKGMRPKEVAHTMGISEASVRLYLKNARLKLGARTKAEAVAKFTTKGDRF